MGKPSEIFEKLEETEAYKEVKLWDRWNEQMLRDRRADLGAKAFSRGYYLESISDEDLTFPSFHKMLQYEIGTELWEGQENWAKFCGVDVSSNNRAGCAIVTVGVDGVGKRFPLEIKVGAWKSPEFVQQLEETYNRFRHQVILVENNAVQTMLVDWLQEKKTWMPVEGFHTGKQKADPNVGLPSLNLEFENEAWALPMKLVEGHGSLCELGERIKDKPQPCAWCRFIAEFAGHPEYESSDLVMATWFAREAIRQYWNTGYTLIREPETEGDFGLMEVDDTYDFT